jgi:rod shape-determining protein MreB
MWRRLFGRQALAIDLGTANTIVYAPGKGVILDEPSVIATTTHGSKRQVLVVGEEAKQMLGRTHGGIEATRPMRDGVIADFELAAEMVKHFILKSQRLQRGAVSTVVVCVPYQSTAVERRAIQESAESAGARAVYLLDEPMASAIGAGLPVMEPTGSMIVDIGGGTTEIAVISLGGIVQARSIRVGGVKLDDAVASFVRRTMNVLIGESTSERVKIEGGSARLPAWAAAERAVVAKGRDIVSGGPVEVLLPEALIAQALAEPVAAIVEGIKDILERTPPELSSDIITNGVYLAGGGALLRCLDEVISEATAVPVHIAEQPLLCVATGAGRVLEGRRRFSGVLQSM